MAKETSLLQADIKQLITGPVMNGIVLDMVGNDWTVDTNGNRFIINEQVIIGEIPSVFNTGLPFAPSFGVKGDAIVAGEFGSVNSDANIIGTDRQRTLINAGSFYIDFDWVTAFTQRSVSDDTFNIISGIVDAPAYFDLPIILTNWISDDAAPTQTQIFGAVGKVSDSAGNFGASLNPAAAWSIVNNGNGNNAIVTISEYGLRVANAWLHVGDGAMNGYIATGGEVRYSLNKFEGFNGTSWVEFGAGGGGSGWSLTGNAGTTPFTNLIGTTDNTDVEFKRNDYIAGFIGDVNTTFGSMAGFNLSTGTGNAFFGTASGLDNTNGNDNTFFGSGSGQTSTGDNNTFVGSSAGAIGAVGNNNSAFGMRAGYGNTGNDNVFVGYFAGVNNLTDQGVFIGAQAGVSNTTGQANTFIGYTSGLTNSSGQFNTYLGSYSGQAGNGNNNVFVGYLSGYFATSSNTVAIGANAGVNNQANDNVFVGYASGSTNTAGTQNSFFGSNAGNNNTGNYNTFLGFQAGSANGTGSSNVFVGSIAGANNMTGNSNTFVGYNAGTQNNSSGNTFIGHQAGQANSTGSENVHIGLGSGAQATFGNYNVFVGGYSGQNNTTGSQNLFVGHSAGRVNSSGDSNTFLGYNAGIGNQIGYQNIFIGSLSGFSMQNGFDNTFIGYQAGHGNVSGIRNIFIGTSAGYTGNNVGDSVFIGYNAGIVNTANQGIFIGSSAGAANTTGDRNTFIGYCAGTSNTTAESNTAIGHGAKRYGATGSYGTFVGAYAGNNTTADNNTFIGSASGQIVTTGGNNTFVGSETGVATTTAADNVFVGYRAGNHTIDGDRNTFVGYQTGFNNDSGINNTFVGWAAGANVKGNDNIGIGLMANRGANSPTPTFERSVAIGNYAGNAMLSNGANVLVGWSAGSVLTGGNTVAIGYSAGYSISTAWSNVMVGYGAGLNTQTGGNNMYLGALASEDNVSGEFNVSIGAQSGADSQTGSNNIFIGAETSVDVDGHSNSIVIGRAAQITGSNQFKVGSATYPIRRVELGDYTSAHNGTFMLLDDVGQSVNFYGANFNFSYQGDFYLRAIPAPGTRVYALGDIDGAHNATGVRINDNSGLAILGDIVGTNARLNVSTASDSMKFIGAGNATYMDLTGGASKIFTIGDIDSAGNGTTVQIDDSAQDIIFTTSVVQTHSNDIPVTAKVVIPSGSLLSIGTSPVQIVAAPGTGYFIQPLSMMFFYDYNSVAYSTGGAYLGLTWDSSAGNLSIRMPGVSIEQTADQYGYGDYANGGISPLTFEDKSLVLTTDDSSDPTSGNGQLTVWVTYKVMSI